MATSPAHTVEQVWSDSAENTPSLGCAGCDDFALCGGLSVEFNLFDCLEFCECPDGADCDAICTRNPAVVIARRREVKGWELSLPQVDGVSSAPKLPHYLPLLYPRPAAPEAAREEPDGPGLIDEVGKSHRFERARSQVRRSPIASHGQKHVIFYGGVRVEDAI